MAGGKPGYPRAGRAGRNTAAGRVPQGARGRLYHRPNHCSRWWVYHHSRMAVRAIIALLAFRLLGAQQRIEFTCPMDPEVRSAQPGKCPKCGLKLDAGIRERSEATVRMR